MRKIFNMMKEGFACLRCTAVLREKEMKFLEYHGPAKANDDGDIRILVCISRFSHTTPGSACKYTNVKLIQIPTLGLKIK